MKRKHCLSILLTLAMLLSLSVCVGASASAEDTIASPMQQIKLISSQMDSLMQTNTENPWYYCVADLDHNGCLEFIAASQHPDDRSTNLKIWTVSKDGASLGECRLSKADEESFPDIMTDTVDTYHDKDTDTWYYMVYDNAVISNAEVYTVKTAVNLKNGIIGSDLYNADVDKKATRAQFAEIFARALPDKALYPKNSIADNAIPDVRMSDSCAPYVYKLYRAGILTGGDALGTFSPGTYITRAEAAAIIVRMAQAGSRVTFSLS